MDYAHTPDARINVLNAAWGGFKRIVTVFGWGHRDRAKRPLMGEAVARLSDVAVLTRQSAPRGARGDHVDAMPGLSGAAEVFADPTAAGPLKGLSPALRRRPAHRGQGAREHAADRRCQTSVQRSANRPGDSGMRLSFEEIVRAVDGSAVAGAAPCGIVEGVGTDSRAVKPGSLFVCIPGETFDGHDFAVKAIEAGAAALLVSRIPDAGRPSRSSLLRIRSRRLGSWRIAGASASARPG
ncbi:MAG: Mur ligase domain-containing protein [Bilophila wadsworthia]